MSPPVRKIRAFTMPKWGIEMEEGVVREWRAKIGDSVKAGDLIAVIETDKIANDVELEYAAVLRRLFVKEGETYRVGQLLAVFSDADVPDSEIETFVSSFKAADAGFGPSAEASTPVAAAPPAIPAGLSISPKALELAKSLSVDLSEVQGSGPGGRVSVQDVEQAAKAQGLLDAERRDDNPYEALKLTPMRRTIARRMSEAAREIPHIFLRADIDLDALLQHRARLGSGAPSVTAYFVKASAVALKSTPDVNIHFVGEEIRRFRHADVAVAIALSGGLVAPVIRRADEKPVSTIAEELKALTERARAEKLTQDELRGGTFSVSNLGMYGVENFDAIVNPPMGAILALGASRRIAVEAAEGFRTVVEATLSCDHRAIDGALGAQFLKALKDAAKRPVSL
jgi:pyruvate dehydrogenase E2 component (dihydrolipoamide acetyltransferase)